MDKCKDERMDGCMNGFEVSFCGKSDVWMDERMDGCMNGWIV